MQFTYVFYFYDFFFIFLQENLLNKIVLKQNKSNLAIRLCLPDDVMTTVMTSVTGSHYNTCFPISFGTCTSWCSCHLKSLTSWKLFCYSQLFFCSWLPLLSQQEDKEKKSKKRYVFLRFSLIHCSAWLCTCYHLMCAKIVFGVRNDLTQSRFIT